jgi:RNA polymerase sigma factor for flagellar operon FliA
VAGESLESLQSSKYFAFPVGSSNDNMVCAALHVNQGALPNHSQSVQAMKKSDQTVRDELLVAHLQLVQQIARSVKSGKPSCVELDDLEQAGMVGLIEAAGRYVHSKGVDFSSYASQRVRGAILDELRKNDTCSRGTRRMLREREAVFERFRQQRLPPPSEQAVAAELGLEYSRYTLRMAQAFRGRDVDYSEAPSYEGPDALEPIGASEYCDATEWDEAGESLTADVVSSGLCGDPAEVLEILQKHQAFEAALLALGDRDRSVVAKYYFEGVSMARIGAMLGVTESRVSQIISRAKRSLRAALCATETETETETEGARSLL